MPSPYALVTMLAAVAAAAICKPNRECVSGAHIIVSRASTEAPGQGLLASVAQGIQARIPGSDIVALDYPAVLEPYVESQTAGVAALTKLIQEYAMKCPRTKMILMGYSQGAHVTADVLCGASEAGFPSTQPQLPQVVGKVAAVVLMGDPSHTNGQPFNLGTSSGSGMFPRQKPRGCAAIAQKTVSYCDADDMFCEKGGTSLAVHMSYVTAYGASAVEFAVSKYKAMHH